jgi:hypothetical protein
MWVKPKFRDRVRTEVRSNATAAQMSYMRLSTIIGVNEAQARIDRRGGRNLLA